jgi:protein-disulfide isomerase
VRAWAGFVNIAALGNDLNMKINLDTAVTATLVVCAFITTALVVRREMLGAHKEPQRPVLMQNWREFLDKGVRIGQDGAPVQLVEFADFECPFCGNFHKTIKSVGAKYPSQIGVTFVHFPIPGHRFAMPLARIAECANDQGRFEAMYDQLFEGQDQFGLKPWDDYAAAASVPDMAAFDACIKKTDPILRVEAGKALGDKLDVQGTPTIIINGWKLGHPPNEKELDQMVQLILAGKQPVDGKS